MSPRVVAILAAFMVMACGAKQAHDAPFDDASTFDAQDVGQVEDASDTARADGPSDKCPAFRIVHCGGPKPCPVGTTCVVSKTPSSFFETGAPPDLGVDLGTDDDGVGIDVGPDVLPTDSIALETGDDAPLEDAPPPDTAADASDDALADTVDAPPSDAPTDTIDPSVPILVPDGVCQPVPHDCAQSCPSTDCVCTAWGLAASCAVDPVKSCRDEGGIVPVVHCAKTK